MRFFYIFLILFTCAVVGEDIQSTSEHGEKNEGHVEKMDASIKEETHHDEQPSPEIIPEEDGESNVNGDTVIVDVKKEVNHDPPADMAPQMDAHSREDTVAEHDSDMSTHAEDVRQAEDAPPAADHAVGSETLQENAADSQAEEPVPHTSANAHEPPAPVDAGNSTPDDDIFSNDEPNTAGSNVDTENTFETEQLDSGSHSAVATEPEEHVENMMNQEVETANEPEPAHMEESIDAQENVEMQPPGLQENVEENGGEQTKEEVEDKIEPAIQGDQTVHDEETQEHVETSEVSPDADEQTLETPVEAELEQPQPETTDPEQVSVISDAPESVSHEASPEEVVPEKENIEHQDNELVQGEEIPEKAIKVEGTVEQVSDPLVEEVEPAENPVEPMPEMVTETVEQVPDPLVKETAETPGEVETEMVRESAEEIVKPIESPVDEESAQPTEVPVVEKETAADEEPADAESSQEEFDDNGGYQSGSLCTYCKYCKDCAKCRNCPTCKEDPSGEHCEICKYCKYCYLCDYICLTVCNPGGFLDSVSGLFYSALPTFPKGGKQEDKPVKEDL